MGSEKTNKGNGALLGLFLTLSSGAILQACSVDVEVVSSL